MDGGIDGAELCVLIRMKEEYHNSKRCRGITAITDANTKKRVKQNGADALLKKPITLDKLRAEVVKVHN
jgi:DNA-binding response OmpR family regulator